MRSRLILFAILMLALFSPDSKCFAQGNWSDKISWSYKIEKIDDNTAYVVGTAKLIPGWHIFSVDHDPMKADFTGYATLFNFVPSSNYELIGKLRDGRKAELHKDELGEQLYFEGTVSFKQKIEVLTDKPFDIKFAASYQICDVNGCMFPPEKEVSLKVSGYTPSAKGEDESEKNLTISGDFAKDKEGNEYVHFLNEWVKVPKGNSAKFYKNYLELGGKYEN